MGLSKNGRGLSAKWSGGPAPTPWQGLGSRTVGPSAAPSPHFNCAFSSRKAARIKPLVNYAFT